MKENVNVDGGGGKERESAFYRDHPDRIIPPFPISISHYVSRLGIAMPFSKLPRRPCWVSALIASTPR